MKLNKVNSYLLAAVLAFSFASKESIAQKKSKKANKSDVVEMKAYTEEEVDAKVKDLLSKMSVEEKVGQMTQVNLNVVLVNGYGNQDGKIDQALLEKAVLEYKVGSILNAINHAYDIPTWHSIVKQIQDVALKTPNKIPVVYGIDAIHGVTFTTDATLFPQNISMGATRNPELARKAGEVTAMECRASGLRWNFAPVLDVARQPLWPRFSETYGEDTYLVKEMGVASIIGMEGDGNLRLPNHVASCMKHYIGYSAPASGKDRTPAYIPERQLREIFLPPFAAAVKAGSETVMINSSEINGIPVHADKYLLIDVLRKELGFKGVAVSDWEDIIRLHTKHKVASTPKEAVKLGVMAGIDMSMVPHDFTFYELLVELVKEGQVPMSRIDEACGRILALKFNTGLFDNAYPEEAAKGFFKKEEYKKVALDAARESIVLLKNKNNTLPLTKGKKILITGPGADSKSTLGGSWSYTWQGTDEKWYPKEDWKTILTVLKEKNGEANVVYTRGTRFDKRDFDIAETVEKAKSVDYVVVCIGEDAYAESPGVIDDLTLSEVQQKLVTELYKAGKPVILVLTEGRPRVIHNLVPDAAAIVYAGVPGSQGALAINEVLFGEYNPDGILPFSYPAFTGDILTYDHKYSDKVTELSPGRMGEGGYKPEWAFGYGLSYTKFEYSDLKLSADKMKGSETLKVSVTVKNAGAKAGKHAVELYTKDLYATITPNVKRLRKFTKINLEAGKSQTVEFELTKADLAFIGMDAKTFVTEAGDFDVMVGDLTKTFKFEE